MAKELWSTIVFNATLNGIKRSLDGTLLEHRNTLLVLLLIMLTGARKNPADTTAATAIRILWTEQRRTSTSSPVFRIYHFHLIRATDFHWSLVSGPIKGERLNLDVWPAPPPPSSGVLTANISSVIGLESTFRD